MSNELCFKYGENSHQTARIEKTDSLLDYEVNGDLTFNETIAVSKGLNLISEFYDVNAACSVKFCGICAVALGQTLADSVQKIMDSNPIDFISSVIVTSSEVDSEVAKFVKESNIIVAPKYTNSALKILNENNIKYVTINTPLKDYKNYIPEIVKATPFGMLIESPNLSELYKNTFKVVSKQKPTVEQIEDAVFAWKVAKHVNSQAVVIAKDLKTTAISQSLCTASVEFALDYSCDMSKDAILASDMPISVHDINVASQGRIGLVIVPDADKDVINQADKYNMALITTMITNILH